MTRGRKGVPERADRRARAMRYGDQGPWVDDGRVGRLQPLVQSNAPRQRACRRRVKTEPYAMELARREGTSSNPPLTHVGRMAG